MSYDNHILSYVTYEILYVIKYFDRKLSRKKRNTRNILGCHVTTVTGPSLVTCFSFVMFVLVSAGRHNAVEGKIFYIYISNT